MKGQRILALIAALVSTSVVAREPLVDWWFEIEVLAFKHNTPVQELDERFEQPVNTPTSDDAMDLIMAAMRPDTDRLRAALPACEPQPAGDEPVLPALDNRLRNALEQAITGLQPNQRLSSPDTEYESGQAEVTGHLDRSPFSINAYSNWLNTGCQYDFEQTYLSNIIEPAPEPDGWIAQIPTTLDGFERPASQKPYLLEKASLQFHELAGKLRYRADVQPLLHLGWRQEVVFGRDNARPLRLVGGQNFAKEYDVLGYLLRNDNNATDARSSDTSGIATLMEQVDKALAGPLTFDGTDTQTDRLGETTEQLFELDGQFRVYLKYINQVPYLHIDTSLVHRRVGDAGLMATKPLAELTMADDNAALYASDATQNQQLYGFEFDQLRRIISSQLHYFDHPMFGLVVEVRRYTRPQPEQAEQPTTDSEL